MGAAVSDSRSRLRLRPRLRLPMAGPLFRVAALCALAAGVWSCQTDFNARSSPLTSGADQAGRAIVFGHYRGLARVGAAGADLAFDLYAEDCGDSMFGTIVLENGETVDIAGGLEGSTLGFHFTAEDGTKGTLVGRVESVRVLSGAWSQSTGVGGEWVAAYIDGSVSDFPCDVADDYLEALD